METFLPTTNHPSLITEPLSFSDLLAGVLMIAGLSPVSLTDGGGTAVHDSLLFADTPILH